jgi:hypothetical protein
MNQYNTCHNICSCYKEEMHFQNYFFTDCQKNKSFLIFKISHIKQGKKKQQKLFNLLFGINNAPNLIFSKNIVTDKANLRGSDRINGHNVAAY